MLGLLKNLYYQEMHFLKFGQAEDVLIKWKPWASLAPQGLDLHLFQMKTSCSLAKATCQKDDTFQGAH